MKYETSLKILARIVNRRVSNISIDQRGLKLTLIKNKDNPDPNIIKSVSKTPISNSMKKPEILNEISGF